MDVLFVHQNFPAQFRCIAPRLAREYGWTCTFATSNDRVPPPLGVDKVIYRPRGSVAPGEYPAARRFSTAIGHAQGVYDALKARPDLRPDLVVAHSGFGSSIFLPHLYDARVINFFEYFYRPAGQDFGYRPDLPVTEAQLLRLYPGNAMILLDLQTCDRGWCPSFYQRDLLPPEHSHKLEVIPEGIDTELYGRGSREMNRRSVAGDRRLPDGAGVPSGARIVTYVSRGFERMRGFDVFMRAAKLIYQRFPEVLFLVVGSDRVCYGNPNERGRFRSFRERVLGEGDYDLSKFRFLGRVPETALAEILCLSDLHVYLTEPFVTSWSMLDAMSCGSVVLASDQACVREYIRHGENGLLCDFFDVEGIAKQAVEVLKDPPA